MATATAPGFSQAVLEDRWRMATTTVTFDDHGPSHPSETNSKAMNQLTRSLEEIAGRMVEDGIDEEDEADSWDRLQFDLLSTIETKIKAYAFAVETARSTRPKPEPQPAPETITAGAERVVMPLERARLSPVSAS